MEQAGPPDVKALPRPIAIEYPHKGRAPCGKTLRSLLETSHVS